MLGHIAIAALGGCFSQDPDTGAAEATYFPTESITLSKSFTKRKTFESGEVASFEDYFTSLRWWTKQNVSAWNIGGYSNTLRVRATANVYYYSGLVLSYHYDNRLSVYVDNGDEHLGITPNTIVETGKDVGSNVFFVAAGNNMVEKRIAPRFAFSSASVVYEIGSNTSSMTTRFWGDFLRNDALNVRWRRVPMICVENDGVALYEADGKELIEY